MFSIHNTTKGKPPRLPFSQIKKAVLGEEYELSLVFIGTHRSRKLNKTYRGKDKPANVLSFHIDEQTGEIYIDMKTAAKEAKYFGRTPRQFIGDLFIHGLFHLKGYAHGSKMESEERKIRKQFNL